MGKNRYDYGSGDIRGASSDGNAVVVKYNQDGLAQKAMTIIEGDSYCEFNSVAVGGSYVYAVGRVDGKGSYDFNNGSGSIAGASNMENAVLVKYPKTMF